MNKDDVVIIGGGIAGLTIAYFLTQAGKKITLIDEGKLTNQSSASFGNAGLISCFEKPPLASPGVILNTLKLMATGKSPLKIYPSINPLFIRWLWSFIKATDEKRMKKTIKLFEKYGTLSIDFYKKISSEIDTEFRHGGLLMVYSERKTFETKKREATSSDKYEIFDFEKTKEYLPFINEKVLGAILLKRNGWLNPDKTVTNLYNYLKQSGVKFVTNEKIVNIVRENSRIKCVKSNKNEYHGETFVLSTGADLILQKQLGLNFNMLPAKGYSITFEMDDELKPKIASLFSDIFVAFTPRKENVRLTSIMEINAKSDEFSEKVMSKILKRFKNLTTNFTMKNIKKWTGFRPLPPNDLPLIGRDKRFQNLIHATGLGWMGITMGPAVAKIVSELITYHKSNEESEDIMLFSGFFQR